MPTQKTSPLPNSRPRKNSSLLATAMAVSLTFGSVAVPQIAGNTASVAFAAGVRGLAFTKWDDDDGVRMITNTQGSANSQPALAGNRLILRTGGVGGKATQFPAGEYTISVNGVVHETVQGQPRIETNADGQTNAVLILDLKKRLNVAENVPVVIETTAPAAGSKPTTGTIKAEDVAVDTVDLQANPGLRDPLKASENTDACIVEVTKRDIGVSTWIAESFYMNPDGSRPRNVKRNYTVLQYRVDGVQGDNAFKPVNGNGVSPWVYNALAYNPADGYLYAVSQDRPQNGADSGLSNNNPDPQYPAGHLLRISPVTGKAESIGRVDGLVDVDVVKSCVVV